jgi:lauroyl/myristoyl acyltransferase
VTVFGQVRFLYGVYVFLVAATVAIVDRIPIEGAGESAGAIIGSIAHRLSGRKRRVSEKRVARAFDGAMTAEQIRAVVRDGFRNFWRDQFATSYRDGAGDCGVVGLHHVREALARGRGVILWESSEFGRRLAAKRILRSVGLVLHQVHSDDHLGDLKPHTGNTSSYQRLKDFFDRQELRFVAEIVRLPRKDLIAGRRRVLRCLRDNGILIMANSGNYGQGIVSVPFLGHERAFAGGFLTLARATGAPLLPVFCVKLPAGGLQVTIEAPIRWDETLDKDRAVESVAKQYAALLESYVRRHPGEYRTWHRLSQSSSTRARRAE